MRSRLSLIVSFCLISQQALAADLCRSITPYLREQPDFVSGERGLGLSILQDPVPFQQTREDWTGFIEGEVKQNAYLSALAKKFDLPELPEQDPIEQMWVERAPGAPFFALATEQGSAHCQGFMIYRSGHPALNLGTPSQGEGLCENSAGSFGLLAGTPAFIANTRNLLDYSERLSITPVTIERLGETCTIEARFEPEFRVAHVFVAPGGIEKGDFAKLAVEFTRHHGLQEEDPALIGVGLPISTDIAASLESMAKAMRDKLESSLPQFGATEKIDGYFTGLKFYPVLLHKRPYAMRFSFGMGYRGRPLPQAYLILFEPRDGKLVPVASAEVDISRGKLSSLN